MLFHRQVTQKGLNMLGRQARRIEAVDESPERTQPGQIGFFRAVGAVAESERLTSAVRKVCPCEIGRLVVTGGFSLSGRQ